MPYCEKCGSELREGEKFCSICGSPVTTLARQKDGKAERSDGTRILFLIFGGIILLVAFGLLLGGGTLLLLNASLIDNEDFLTTESYQLERDSYAIAFQDIDIDVGEVTGTWGMWQPSPSDLVTIKLTGLSNDPSRNIFFGIAKGSDVEEYLFDVYYDEITQFSISSLQSLNVEFNTHPGDSVTSEPASQTFWIVSDHGVGTQTIEWSPEVGNYWIVLMNEDGSATIDFNITFGAKIPLLYTIAVVLLIGGVIALLIGSVIVYFRVHQKKILR